MRDADDAKSESGGGFALITSTRLTAPDTSTVLNSCMIAVSPSEFRLVPMSLTTSTPSLRGSAGVTGLDQASMSRKCGTTSICDSGNVVCAQGRSFSEMTTTRSGCARRARRRESSSLASATLKGCLGFSQGCGPTSSSAKSTTGARDQAKLPRHQSSGWRSARITSTSVENRVSVRSLALLNGVARAKDCNARAERPG
jgi:hypothetical protein